MSKPFVIQRLLQVPLNLMWEVLTQPEHLLNWLGPKGSTMVQGEMDFRVGGSFHYCLQMPGDAEPRMWGQWHLLDIDPPNQLVLLQNFSNAEGLVVRHPMAPTWPLQTHSTMRLDAQDDDKTLMTIRWVPYEASPQEIATFEAGFASMNQGWSGNLDVLENYLARLQDQE